jgi:MFS family permease
MTATITAGPTGRTDPAARDLRRFLIGQVASVFGSTMTTTAVSVIAVVGLDAGPAELTVVIGAGVLPALLLGPVLGVLLDRVRRPRRMLIAADLVAAGAVGATAVAGLSGALSIALLALLTLVLGATRIVMESLYFSHLNGLGVTDLGRARGRLQSSELVSRSLAASLAGPVAAAVSATLLFLGDALTYLISAAFLLSLRSPDRRPAPTRTRANVRRELADGLREVRNHPVLGGFLLSVLIGGAASSGIAVQRAVFLLDELDLPVALFTVPAVAAMLLGAAGAVLAPRLMARGVTAPRILVAGLSAAAVLTAALPLAGGHLAWVLVAATIGAAGPALFGTMANIALVTVISDDVGDEFFARITALLASAATVAGLVGLALGGALGEWLGVRSGIWVCVALDVAAAAVLVRSSGGRS